MGTVSDLPQRGESGPYLTGPCKCFKCKHEWQGVMPVGTANVECPACGCWGVRIGLVSTGGEQWACKCGCSIFRIDRAGPYCVECGELAVGWF